MKCPNCERRIGPLALRCRVCRQRLPFWYIFVTMLVAAAVVGIIYLLERV